MNLIKKKRGRESEPKKTWLAFLCVNAAKFALELVDAVVGLDVVAGINALNFEAAAFELGVVDVVTTAGEWGRLGVDVGDIDDVPAIVYISAAGLVVFEVTLTIIAASVTALDEWELLVVSGDVSGGSASGVGLLGLLGLLLILLLILLLVLLLVLLGFDILNFLEFLDFLDISGGAGMLLEKSFEVVGISWVEVALQWSEVNGELLNISKGELSWSGN